MRKQLFLASGSESKASLLRQLGVEFDPCNPQVNESPLSPEEPPRLLAERLASDKSQHGIRQILENFNAPEAVHIYVIGADQTITTQPEDLSFSTRYERYNKPNTPERAVEQLMRLQGNTHTLITAVCVTHSIWKPSTSDRCSDTLLSSLVDSRQHMMCMHPLTREQAARYVDADSPLQCAGSYKIESLGISLFSDISGPDYTTIIGLPLTCVQELLHKSGYFEKGTFPI